MIRKPVLHGMTRCGRCKIDSCVEHNIETLRTRVTQVADLRDAQGIRADHRTIVARLDEVEEYASANTFISEYFPSSHPCVHPTNRSATSITR